MKMFEKIHFQGNPTVLAAWPGMGNVGLITVDFIRRSLGAETFAELDMSPFFIPESIVVKDGIAQFPQIPSSIFYYTTDPDLIIFESNAQVGGRDGITIIKTILDVLVQFPVSQVITYAAFSHPMSYRNESQVYVTCNQETLLQKLSGSGAVPMPDGYIAGLNGLLLAVAASRHIDSSCLLGTIPNYAANLDYPKAALELVRMTCRVLDLDIDTEALEASVESTEEQLEVIEDRIRQFFPTVNTEEDSDVAGIEEEHVPHYIMDRIERMFRDVADKKSSAADLKKELDRWNLYELYENRFLDLFE